MVGGSVADVFVHMWQAMEDCDCQICLMPWYPLTTMAEPAVMLMNRMEAPIPYRIRNDRLF